MTGYLLDTHVMLWWAEDPSLLTDKARAAIHSGHNQIYVSMATPWEMAIKQRLGKLSLMMTAEEIMAHGRFMALPISFAHTNALQALPLMHGDPFDRMMVAQAQVEKLVLITRDRNILRYDIETIAA